MKPWLRWVLGIDLPPWGRALPPIAVHYYRCTRCDSLAGGISGKGPWKSRHAAQAKQCRHAWQSISAESFQARFTAS